MKNNWVRWLYEDGWGRWHVVADVGVDEGGHNAVMLACGRARHMPQAVREAKPTEDVCEPCDALDKIRSGYGTRTPVRELVPA